MAGRFAPVARSQHHVFIDRGTVLALELYFDLGEFLKVAHCRRGYRDSFVVTDVAGLDPIVPVVLYF